MSAENEDPWKHRSDMMKCASCMWFMPKGDDDNFGRCRRHSPVVGEGYPAVFGNDWCGDHKIDERKLK